MLELKNINKSFGLVQANKNVCLKVKKGDIHGIIGENGAGKSTLMSILYGFYPADSGTIFIDDSPTKINNSKDAIRAGIGMVHQHFMLVDTFNTVENVILGAEENISIASSLAKATEKLKKLEKDYNLKINLTKQAGDLPVGEQQRIEIFKALYRKAKILILDEPTGVLTPQEADNLFKILLTLKKEGVTIILITHKLREIMSITDSVTVMRKGETIKTVQTSTTNPQELAKLMVGRDVNFKLDKKSKASKKILLEVKNLNFVDDFNVTRLRNINFKINAGEILGVAGVSGNGQSELLKILSGITKIKQGELIIDGNVYNSKSIYNPTRARELGVMHIPEDRIEVGMVKEFSAKENSILGYQKSAAINKNYLLQEYIINKGCLDLIESFDIRPKDSSLVTSNFSGGNQQKLLLAREMNKKTKVFLIGQPTRGVDIGAIESIHKKLLEQKNQGKAILLVSAELDEIMALSDRIIVIFQGEIVSELKQTEATHHKLGLMMANIKSKKIDEQKNTSLH